MIDNVDKNWNTLDITATALIYDKWSSLIYDKWSSLIYDKSSSLIYDKSSALIYDKCSSLGPSSLIPRLSPSF